MSELKSRPLLFALAAHLVVLFVAIPVSPWEFDEPLFFHALHEYNPLAHHPPPPGYPLFILFGQSMRQLIPSDFATLLAISIAASAIGFVMLALAFRNLTGDMHSGAAGALLFYLSPAMLVHSTLPISEAGALALLATALYYLSSGAAGSQPTETDDDGGLRARRSTILFALFAALAIGWRIQFSIFIVPLFLVAVALMRSWRHRVIALAVFTLICIVWLVPLTVAVGGVRELIDFETGQGKYLATHDAAESRTGWTPARIAFRFIGRAWGTELMALFALGMALFGFVVAVRKHLRALLPLLAGGAVYIGVALWVMDPADGVRYAIPFVLVTAFFFGVGIMTLPRRHAYVAMALAVFAFFLYVGPLLMQRRHIESSPVRAAEFAREAFPPNAVALYELPLAPHASYYLSDRNPRRVDEGLAEFYDRPEVPLFIYADGATMRADARVFEWKTSDAYEKLTRNHYRATSIIPVPPERRFRIVNGVYAPEREQDGLEWRWLASPAELQLPRGPARSLTLRLGLPEAAPLDANAIAISVDGVRVAEVRVERGTSSEVTVAVPAGAPIIRLDAARTFIPAEVPALRSGDRRVLAVELYELWTTAAAAPTPPPPA